MTINLTSLTLNIEHLWTQINISKTSISEITDCKPVWFRRDSASEISTERAFSHGTSESAPWGPSTSDRAGETGLSTPRERHRASTNVPHIKRTAVSRKCLFSKLLEVDEQVALSEAWFPHWPKHPNWSWVCTVCSCAVLNAHYFNERMSHTIEHVKSCLFAS